MSPLLLPPLTCSLHAAAELSHARRKARRVDPAVNLAAQQADGLGSSSGWGSVHGAIGKVCMCFGGKGKGGDGSVEREGGCIQSPNTLHHTCSCT